MNVFTFETCQVNGYKFSTRSIFGSGVVVKWTSHHNNLDYYAHVQEIIKLIKQGGNYVYVFKYLWFESIENSIIINKNQIVMVDITSRLRSNEIFILVSQTSQVYYNPRILNPQRKWYTYGSNI